MNRKLSMTQIRKALMKCVFNPREPGPIRLIVESGGREYRLSRAVEFIKQTQSKNDNDELVNAIRLLALVMVEDENAQNL